MGIANTKAVGQDTADACEDQKVLCARWLFFTILVSVRHTTSARPKTKRKVRPGAACWGWGWGWGLPAAGGAFRSHTFVLCPCAKQHKVT